MRMVVVRTRHNKLVLIGSNGGHLGFSKCVFAILIPVCILKGSTILNVQHNIDSCMVLQPQISGLRSTSVFVRNGFSDS